MLNPYLDINWSEIEYLISTNHWHCLSKDSFVGIYDTGLRHFALTNYQPAHPTYPLHDQQFFAITEQEIPEDVIPCPNSEKVNFLDASMHISCPGSLAATYGHDWPGEEPKWTWHDKFDYIFSNLQYADGGGIIINHPVRSNNTVEQVIEKLLYDKRVLGMEVINHRSQRDYSAKGYWLNGWDSILKQGYRCFGFFSPDEHNLPSGYVAGDDMRLANYGLGRNILLVPAKTEEEALRAYRQGAFYGAFFGDRIKFTCIEMDGNKFYVETDGAEKIDFISYSLYGTNVVENDRITVYRDKAEFTADTYTIFVRAEAFEDKDNISYDMPITSERIYTQPIMFKSPEQITGANSLIGRSPVRRRAKLDGEWKNVKRVAVKESGLWVPVSDTMKVR